MKKPVFVLVLLAVITMLPICKKNPELMVTVQFSVGDARIVSASGEKAASSGDVVSYNDSIVTGASSVVDLNFGTKGVIRITENSSVKMAMLQAPAGNGQIQFDMKKGKIYAILSKLVKGSSFQVLTPTTVVAVRGTSFMIVSDPSNSKICVIKGRVLVQLAKEGKLAENIETILEANKKVIVSEDLANEIIAGKKKMEVTALSQKEISDIKKEIKNIKMSDKLDQEAQKELQEITRDSDVKPGAIQKKEQEPQDTGIQNAPSI
jgi:hypothetical protein